jgi:hypothetical protein
MNTYDKIFRKEKKNGIEWNSSLNLIQKRALKKKDKKLQNIKYKYKMSMISW